LAIGKLYGIKRFLKISLKVHIVLKKRLTYFLLMIIVLIFGLFILDLNFRLCKIRSIDICIHVFTVGSETSGEGLRV